MSWLTLYTYCLTYDVCWGRAGLWSAHSSSSSSWPEVCVYKQPSLRAFICPVGRGAIKVRYAFVMWHVRPPRLRPRPPSLLSSSSSLAFTHDVREKSYPIIHTYSYYTTTSTYSSYNPCFLISFFDFLDLDFFFLKEETVDISLARLFIRTPTDLHSIMYI